MLLWKFLQTPEENYELLKDGLYANMVFRKALGTADKYLDRKKLQGRLEWSRESHKKKYENFGSRESCRNDCVLKIVSVDEIKSRHIRTTESFI
ncbi:MAG: hypothetical protein NC321_12630 [Clostridium sp.]|nr:hypothetical protein [Clostridium sp.]